MPRSAKSFNPFYAMLVLVGTAFVVTACAYTVMCYVTLQGPGAAGEGATAGAEHGLFVWMSRYGTTALVTEVVLLGLLTAGAIGTDEFWQRRAHRADEQDDQENFKQQVSR